jgi:hypothetical protein
MCERNESLFVDKGIKELELGVQKSQENESGRSVTEKENGACPSDL